MKKIIWLFSEATGLKYLPLMIFTLILIMRFVDGGFNEATRDTALIPIIVVSSIMMLFFSVSQSSYSGFLKLVVSLPVKQSDITKGLMGVIWLYILIPALSALLFFVCVYSSTGDFSKLGTLWKFLYAPVIYISIINLLFPFAIFKSEKIKIWMSIFLIVLLPMGTISAVNALDMVASAFLQKLAAIMIMAAFAVITSVICYKQSMERIRQFEF